MSEYQYYEFLAIDRPLASDEMAALRGVSSRAQISPMSFVNEYNWGDFKGSPSKLMEHYFDAHVYVASWRTAVFMVRLPIEALARETVDALAEDEILEFISTPTHWIITWRLSESEDYERFGMDDGRGWMARLAPVRDELLRGDIRSLYIAWLATVAWEIRHDDDLEPVCVIGLSKLTAAQMALAEFLEVDPDLLAGAAMGNPDAPEGIAQQEMDAWIEGLQRQEMAAILKQILEGHGLQAERELKNRFAAWRRSTLGESNLAPRRRVGEIRGNAEAAQNLRIEKERRALKQREAKQRKERETFLKGLCMDFPNAWLSVQRMLQRGPGKLTYDLACRALVDLSQAYDLNQNRQEFQQEMKNFMKEHKQRKALVQRLVAAGIWKE
jgi:hypothetical protein